jgi:hypothetical protein
MKKCETPIKSNADIVVLGIEKGCDTTRRIDKAFDILKGMAKCEIIPNYCPYQINASLPDIDTDTYKTSDSINGPGCRGINCEECWNTELK